MNGVNPLGLVSNQCFQVSSDIALLYNKNGATIFCLLIFCYIKIPQIMKIPVSSASLKFAILTRPLTPALLSVLMDITR